MTAVDHAAFEVVCEDTTAIGRSEWLELRRQGLGSSDAAPAMGMSPWGSPYSVWCNKRGLTGEQDDNERFLWGRLLEPIILDQAQERGWCPPGTRHLMLRSTERPWMLANPDMLCPGLVVEAKTADGRDERRWEEGIPDQYTIQGHHLMAVCGTRRCLFPVLFGGVRLAEFWVEWDDALAEVMFDQEAEFWRRVVENDPPDPDGSDATMVALRERYSDITTGQSVELPAEAADWLVTRHISVARIAAETEVLNGVKAHVMDALGEAEIGTVNGDKAVTWKATKAGTRRLMFIENGEK